MKTEKVALLALVLVLSTLLLATGAPAGQSECDEIATLLINNTTITSTNYVFPAGYLPGYCEVTATVSPETDVAVRLPDNWLGRYLHLGGGGFDECYLPWTLRSPEPQGIRSRTVSLLLRRMAGIVLGITQMRASLPIEA